MLIWAFVDVQAADAMLKDGHTADMDAPWFFAEMRDERIPGKSWSR